MMNARRWSIADGYHRRRQSLHYQSLYQPGIVAGLGVRVIEPPESVDAKFRDQRWLQIQPGVAIDVEGNPIIVDASTDRRYRIEARPSGGKSLTVYIVVSYAEPQIPTGQSTTELLREWFRFDQITHPPQAHQVELCRIVLKEPVQLDSAIDVLTPTPNQLDFRYRLRAQPRPQAVIRIAQIRPGHHFEESSDLATFTHYQRNLENLSELMASVFSLYPALSGDAAVPSVNLETDELSDYDLLSLPDPQALNQISPTGFIRLNQYLQAGGGLAIECSGSIGQSFESLKQQLQAALPDAISPHWLSWSDLPRQHLLRRSPFLFGSLPTDQLSDLQLTDSGSVLLLDGTLSSAWGLADGMRLPRSEIRTAQELGVNILHFFWQRRQWTQLRQWEEPEDATILNSPQ